MRVQLVHVGRVEVAEVAGEGAAAVVPGHILEQLTGGREAEAAQGTDQGVGVELEDVGVRLGLQLTQNNEVVGANEPEAVENARTWSRPVNLQDLQVRCLDRTCLSRVTRSRAVKSQLEQPMSPGISFFDPRWWGSLLAVWWFLGR